MKLLNNRGMNHWQKSIRQKLLQERILHSIDVENVLGRHQFILFTIFSLTGAVACLGVFAKMCFLFGSLNTIHYLVPLLAGVMLTNFYTIRDRSVLPRAYLIAILSAFALLHIVSYSTGGIRSASILFHPVVILYAYLLLGRRGGLSMSILFVIHVGYMFVVTRYTELVSYDFLQNKKEFIDEDFLVNAVFTFFLIAAHSQYLNSTRNIVLRKLTEQRDLLVMKNKQLQQSNLTLERANKELDKFAYVTSHDLKAPLRAIGSLAGIIQEEVRSTDPVVCNNLKMIQGRVQRMEGLINGILTYSKTVRAEDTHSNVSITGLIQECIDLLNAGSFCTVSEKDLPQTCKVCSSKLQQVLLNLIENAIRHSDKDHPKIDISVTMEANYLQFSVQDDGPGIPDQYRERIFIIFQTLKPRDEFENIGIGLAIVKRLVDDAGGSISLVSEAGKGTSFIFSWPLFNEHSQQKIYARDLFSLS